MASGFYLGGMADGMRTGAKTSLEQQAETRTAEAAQRAEIDKQITATMTHINEIFKAQTAAGQAPNPNNPAIKSLLDSVAPLAAKIGRDPQQLALTVGAMAQRPPLEDADSKKKIVTTSGGLGEPDRLHVFDERKGTLTPIDPKTGQPTADAPAPAINPAIEGIPPSQAARANPAAQPTAPVQQDDAALPPNAKPISGPIDMRFGAMEPPTPVLNPNINEDAIAALSPGAQGLVKGVADGTVDPVKAFSARQGKDGKSERTKFLEKVKEYDPSFDMANFGARSATLKAFKSGVEARKLTALGTVVGHVHELYKDGEALDNWKSNTFGPATKTANTLRTMMKENEQSPIVRRFELSATAVANELENAFRGNTTAISGIQEWRRSINPAMASDEIAQSTQKLGGLLLARMSELKEQWDRGMGHNQDPSISLKIAATRQLLEKMTAGTLFSDKTVKGSPANAAADPLGLR